MPSFHIKPDIYYDIYWDFCYGMQGASIKFKKDCSKEIQFNNEEMIMLSICF